MIAPDPRKLIDASPDPVTHDEIRRLWKKHSIAEDARDIAGLLSTLTDDCVYEIAGVERKWQGHAGARKFYEELLGAFPDVRFELRYIVIGPQGVCEEARLTGTHRGDWLGQPPTGKPVDLQVVIFFPWDPERRLFAGERVFVTPGRGVAGAARA